MKAVTFFIREMNLMNPKQNYELDKNERTQTLTCGPSCPRTCGN